MQPPLGHQREFMQSMCSFSATTASIHLLFGANTIASHTYFRVGQATGLNSEAGGSFEEKCKLSIFFHTYQDIRKVDQKPAHIMSGASYPGRTTLHVISPI